MSIDPKAADKPVLCADCSTPCAYFLCDACLTRAMTTPVPGEALPWEAHRDIFTDPVMELAGVVVLADDDRLSAAILCIVLAGRRPRSSNDPGMVAVVLDAVRLISQHAHDVARRCLTRGLDDARAEAMYLATLFSKLAEVVEIAELAAYVKSPSGKEAAK